MITGKLIDRNVKFTRLLCLPEAASSSNKLLLVAVLAILGALTACGDAHLPLLTSILVTPANSTIDIGQTQQFTAVGTFSDGSSKDLTNLVTWSSSNTTVAAISSSGLALGQGKGSSMISVAFNTVDGPVTGATSLGVIATLKSLTVTPVNQSIANGTSLQLTATGIFSDGSTQNLTASASWSSSSGAIATVSSGGVVTGTGAGSATITATQAGVSGATTVTVTTAVLTSITITPPNFSIANGTSQQLTANGIFSDGTTQDLTAFVTWASSAGSIATVSNAAGSQGVVMGTAAGSTTITATQAGVSGATTVTVTTAVLKSITITPPNSSIAKGTSEQLTATGIFSDGSTQDLTDSASWTSSSGAIATVSSSGLLTGTGVGSATITATQAGVSGATTVTVTAAVLTSITITPPNSSIAKGTSEQFTANGIFSDGTTQDLTAFVTWASSAGSIATVSNAAGSQGVVMGTAAGSTTITATQAGVSGATTVTVTHPVLVAIVVTPSNSSIANGTTEQLTAIGAFSDGTTQDLTTQVSWVSSSDTIAHVDDTPVSPGLVTGTGVGSSTITATHAGVSGSAAVTVTAAVLTSLTVTPANTSIPVGTGEQLIATGTFSDGTTKDLTTSVTWGSSDTTLAAVSSAAGSEGFVTGHGLGSVTIGAVLPEFPGVTGSASVTVTAAILTSIAVTPANPSIANGGTIQLTATGTFSDGMMKDLTTQVSWVSSSDTIAHVDDTPVSPGLATGTGVGSPTITATLGTVTGGTIVTVLAACNVGDGTSVAAYNAIPFQADNCQPHSYAFESNSVSEFGNGVALAANTGRTLVSLNVVFSSFACGVSGIWYDGTCQTTPGQTFVWPITANIYAVNDLTTPLATVTQNQTIPYRPSADPVHCPEKQDQWFNPLNITNSPTSPGKCQDSIQTVLTFTFTTPVTLPDQVVWTVEFNTSGSGPDPVGPAPCNSSPAGCPYDELNVGAKTYPGSPYAGTNIDPNGAYQNSTLPGSYFDGGTGGLGFLRLDTGPSWWTGNTPLGEVITH